MIDTFQIIMFLRSNKSFVDFLLNLKLRLFSMKISKQEANICKFF